MKKILAAGLMLTSFSVFSQSYLVLNNGVTLTTDKAGFVYDFNHFRVPYKVSVNGGRFMVEDKRLSTVDASGFLYEKKLEVKKIKGKGLNYFLNDNNKLITIDEKGFYYEYDKDSKIFRAITGFGGNFFLVKPNSRKPQVDLYTVNNKGNYFKIDVPGLNPADIKTLGGTYFQTKNGTVYTVSNEGFVFPKTETKVGNIVKTGGNYFIDSTGKLFTVADNGLLILPILPMNIKVNTLQELGANYMIDSDGRLFVVDSLGAMYEREVEHDLREAKIIAQ